MPHVAAASVLDLRALYPKARPWVRRALRGLGIAPADVDDLEQDVLLTLHRRGITFADERSARAWLYGTARRVASNHRRADRRREARLAGAWEPVALPSPEELVDGRRLAATWDRLVTELTPRQRDVFHLAEVDGLSGPAIADRLGLPLDTTYSHLRRARSRLRGLGLTLLVLLALAVTLLSSTCANEGAGERARVALRGSPDARG